MTARLTLFVAFFIAALPAYAYMGPGAGLGMLGSLVAVAGALLLAVFGLLVLPVRIIMKRRRKATEQKSA
jgi:hypothetical protein